MGSVSGIKACGVQNSVWSYQCKVCKAALRRLDGLLEVDKLAPAVLEVTLVRCQVWVRLEHTLGGQEAGIWIGDLIESERDPTVPIGLSPLKDILSCSESGTHQTIMRDHGSLRAYGTWWCA